MKVALTFLFIGFLSAGCLRQDNYDAPAPVEARPAFQLTMAKYNALRTGMTYAEAVKIIGREGEELSSNEIAGNKTVMYMWKSEGGAFDLGNMNAMFQNGKLIQKAQFGLK